MKDSSLKTSPKPLSLQSRREHLLNYLGLSGSWLSSAAPIAAIAGSGCATTVPTNVQCAPKEYSEERVRKAAEKLHEDGDARALAYVVSFEGRTLISGVRGTADDDEKIAMTTAHRFCLNENSILFTQLLTLILAKQGKIALDAPIQNYLIGEKLWPITYTRHSPPTILQLLHNQAGFGLAHLAFFNFGNGGSPNLRHDFENAPWFNGGQLGWKPGYIQAQSLVGYALLGKILCRLSKKSFDVLLQELLLSPLKLKDTGLAGIGKYPPLYVEAADERFRTHGPFFRDLPAIGLISSAHDMAKILNIFTCTEANWLNHPASQLINFSDLELLRTPKACTVALPEGQSGALGMVPMASAPAYGLMRGTESYLQPHGSFFGYVPEANAAVLLMGSQRPQDKYRHAGHGVMRETAAIIQDRAQLFQAQADPSTGNDNGRGFFASFIGVIEIDPTEGSLKVMDYTIRLKSLPKLNRYSIEYRLFGLFKLPITALENISAQFMKDEQGRRWIAMRDNAALMCAAELPIGKQILPEWREQLGHWVHEHEGPAPLFSGINLRLDERGPWLVADFLHNDGKKVLLSLVFDGEHPERAHCYGIGIIGGSWMRLIKDPIAVSPENPQGIKTRLWLLGLWLQRPPIAVDNA